MESRYWLSYLYLVPILQPSCDAEESAKEIADCYMFIVIDVLDAFASRHLALHHGCMMFCIV
ncbi:hypothetical protein, partial [Selenomonas bovis]|uniref:hypothetical protein n=1 Tax=Selenomonas bovis TaxID=416586 RepID=UPI003D056C39